MTEEPTTILGEYAQISIAFDVNLVLDVAPDVTLIERPVDPPYVKNYDALDGGPLSWPRRFDLGGWQLFGARGDGQLVGGAAVILDPGDQAILWDIRVSPGSRRRGVGAALFEAATQWACDRGCRRFGVETQSNNVPACRFYQRQGCTLAEVERRAYPELPEEVKLVWFRDLDR